MSASSATAISKSAFTNKTLAWVGFISIFTALFMLMPVHSASAQSAAEGASSRQVAALLSSAHRSSGNLGGLTSVVRKHFAVGTWTNALLGKQGKKFSGSQKSEFKRLFPSYIAKQYFKQFGGSNGKAGQVTKTRSVRGDVLVTSRIPSRGRTFTVVWRMRVIGGKPRVIDYSTGGVSAVVLRRAEFQAKVKQSGPNGLNSFIKAFVAS